MSFKNRTFRNIASKSSLSNLLAKKFGRKSYRIAVNHNRNLWIRHVSFPVFFLFMYLFKWVLCHFIAIVFQFEWIPMSGSKSAAGSAKFDEMTLQWIVAIKSINDHFYCDKNVFILCRPECKICGAQSAEASDADACVPSFMDVEIHSNTFSVYTYIDLSCLVVLALASIDSYCVCN